MPEIKPTQAMQDRLAKFIWGSLRRDQKNLLRRQTSWGTKTPQGLLACVLRIVNEEKTDE